MISSVKLLEKVEKIVREESDLIVKKLMERFDEEIIPFEDEDDPARPSLCRDEFEQFIKDSLEENIKISKDSIEVGVGDGKRLGIDEELDEDTTDCLRIIGTILQGITGEYVLVTSDMTGGPEGRFGKAFILPVEQYRSEAVKKGWDPFKPMWQFSNFPGLPDFFSDLDLSDFTKTVRDRLAEELSV